MTTYEATEILAFDLGAEDKTTLTVALLEERWNQTLAPSSVVSSA